MKTFNVTGTRYSNEKTFYDWDKQHQFPHFTEIEKVNLGEMKFESVDEASRWLLTNHPDLWCGCSIVEVRTDDKPNDFYMNAVKDYWIAEHGDNFNPLSLLERPLLI